MADQRRDVHAGRGLGDRLGVGGEGGKLVGRARAEQVHRLRRLPGEGHRGEADAAIAGDDGRHALADLRQHVGRVEHDAVVMRVGVDEARRKRPALQIVLMHGRSGRDGAGRADLRDALAGNRKLAAHRAPRRCRRSAARCGKRGRNEIVRMHRSCRSIPQLHVLHIAHAPQHLARPAGTAKPEAIESTIAMRA